MKKLLLVLVGVAILGFAWWTLSPLLINTAVSDSLNPELERLIADPSETVPGVSMRGPFTVTDTPGHPATGAVRVIKTDTDTTVRFEDYNGTNGPDLFVYLAKDLEADEFINLGRARGNMGNINYSVPSDVDISEYRYVMTWCRAFGVLFDYAEIN